MKWVLFVLAWLVIASPSLAIEAEDCGVDTCSYALDANGDGALDVQDYLTCVNYISQNATPCGPGIVGGCGE